MKPILLILFVFAATSSKLCTQNRAEASNALLQDLIKNQKVMGASASFAVDNNVVWEAAAGFADQDTDKKFTLTTKTRIASISKSMTAVAIMQLVEKGLLDINLPVDTYFPEFIQNGNTKITTKHLLTHTSGIDAYKNNKEIENTETYKTLEDAYAIFKTRQLRFEPGTQFFYTSYGYVVLGLIIEKVSGLSYEAYMQKYVWSPIGMEHTGLEKTDMQKTNVSTLYHRHRKGKIKEAKPNNLSDRIPAGGMYSTVNDLIKFGNALLNNTLVSQNTIELMTTHHSLEKVNNSYGFGFYLYGKPPNEGGIYGHNGAQTGASAQLFIVPGLKTVIAVVSNTSLAGRDVSTVAGKFISISQQKQ